MVNNVFVLSDNLVLFKAIKEILDNRKLQVDYYHSPKSSDAFKGEDNIVSLNLKESYMIDVII